MKIVIGVTLIVKLILQRKQSELREISHKPLILVIVTPLMARAHAHIQQASEIVSVTRLHLLTDLTPLFS